MAKPKIAIIGGGLAGLTAATQLKADADIALFEKARGVGGRMSTRRAEPFQFDHGAQYFTARSEEFKSFLAPFIADKSVQEWKGKLVTIKTDGSHFKRDWFEPHYVASPRMNSLCKTLAQDLNAQFKVEISKLEKTEEQWLLHDKKEQSHGPFDYVIITAPAAQAVNLAPEGFTNLDKIRASQMTGCYTVMLGFETLPQLNWDMAMPESSSIGWIAVNSDKPGRSDTAPSILVQSTNEWAEDHIDEDVEAMQKRLIEDVCQLTGIDESQILHAATHRWRYANTAHPAGDDYFFHDNVGICGDWCIKGRVEYAYLSAYKLCQHIKSRF